MIGVKFMYDCVMAMQGHDGKGCILADEMYVQPIDSHFAIITAPPIDASTFSGVWGRRCR